MEKQDEKPCPHCGRCPTCGQVPNAKPWPTYPRPIVWYSDQTTPTSPTNYC